MDSSDQPSHNVEKVSLLFDQMAEDYDDLRDLWYAWLFSRLHFLIAKHVLSKWTGKKQRVLDIGCGTGFQSYLYALTGAEVTGIDIAQELLALAREKGKDFRKRNPFPLFPARFDFVTDYNRRIGKSLHTRFDSAPLLVPTFRVADATRLPFEDDSVDHVNCCGSTLNYVDDHNAALQEMARVLRTGGTFVIEVDAKYNCDLLWPALDATIFFGRLGYETTPKEAFDALFSKIRSHITIQYPFGEVSNPVYMDLKLFERTTLLNELEACGLECKRLDSIHSITNLIPSTLLDTSKPSQFLQYTFGLLAHFEERLPFYLPGCSLVVFGTKSDRSRKNKQGGRPKLSGI
jgi:ubiquinone/menaquinone biosynthesis C-methylase UbiE